MILFECLKGITLGNTLYCRLDIEEQHDVVMTEFNTGWAARAASDPNDEIIKSGVNPDDIRKWNVLQNLQDRNETLFYK